MAFLWMRLLIKKFFFCPFVLSDVRVWHAEFCHTVFNHFANIFLKSVEKKVCGLSKFVDG